MKTRFDCADSWTTATGEEIQIKEMTTIHLIVQHVRSSSRSHDGNACFRH